MKILLSSTKGFLREGAGVFGGVENFTSMFIPYWKKSKHSFIAFDFRPPKNKKISLTFRTKSEGKNRIVMIKLWIPGLEILNLLQGKHSASTGACTFKKRVDKKNYGICNTKFGSFPYLCHFKSSFNSSDYKITANQKTIDQNY
jgi:hypothetical protein